MNPRYTEHDRKSREGERCMEKKGAVFSFSSIVIMTIVIILLAVGVNSGYYLVNSWRANAVKSQADEIDRALVSYAKHHKGVQDKGMYYNDDDSKLIYSKTQDYPLYLDSFGQISERNQGSAASDDYGIMDAKIEFCKENEEPQSNLYKFKYTPRDRSGNVITVSSPNPAAYYTLEVYYRNEKGDIIRYVSPGSYENIKDNEKPL